MAAGTVGQWWVVWNASTGAIDVVQSATKPAAPASGKVFGPYTSRAAAQAEANPNSSLFQQLGVGAQAGAAQATAVGSGVTDPLAFLGSLGGISHWIGTFVTNITDLHLWISLGWLFLGFILLIVGLLLFLKHEDLLPKGVPIPVPV